MLISQPLFFSFLLFPILEKMLKSIFLCCHVTNIMLARLWRWLRRRIYLSLA